MSGRDREPVQIHRSLEHPLRERMSAVVRQSAAQSWSSWMHFISMALSFSAMQASAHEVGDHQADCAVVALLVREVLEGDRMDEARSANP
jgi:hypothetical protein